MMHQQIQINVVMPCHRMISWLLFLSLFRRKGHWKCLITFSFLSHCQQNVRMVNEKRRYKVFNIHFEILSKMTKTLSNHASRIFLFEVPLTSCYPSALKTPLTVVRFQIPPNLRLPISLHFTTTISQL